LFSAACSSITTVRLQPETVDVGPGLRPIAGIQSTASTFYVLFIPIPGGVNLDRVVNRMLLVAAKTMGADKVANLQFHVESFLHELYILQARLVQFLKFVERQHRRDPRLPQIKAACAVLSRLVIDSMKKGIAIRGSHVHRWRMSDTKIDRLNAITFYTMMPNKKIKRVFKAFYESEYRKTRKHWRGWITGGIAEAQKLVDAYFDEVFKLMFDDKGKAGLSQPTEVLTPGSVSSLVPHFCSQLFGIEGARPK